MNLIDLDAEAARREITNPDGLPVRFRGEEYLIPAELPVDVFDPFLEPGFDLAGLIREAIAEAKEPGIAGEKGIDEVVIDLVFNRPDLPVKIINAVYSAYEILFGPEQYARFRQARPSLPDYMALTRGLFRVYGTSVGEAFASVDSSETSGLTQKPTLPASTGSTPEPSGAPQEPAPVS